MSVTVEAVRAALATVKDPEIRRPITELDMVADLSVDGSGVVGFTLLLTIAGCPMRNTIEADVTEALIPFVDRTFRTVADRDHRAMAGLSMGGMQTYQITLNHLDLFSHIGGFSGAAGSMTLGRDLDPKTDYNGVTGKIAFDERGDIKDGALTLYTFKGGAREQIAVVK